jgi:chromosome segregation ATPase
MPDLALKAVLTHDGKRAIAGDWTGQIFVWSTADGKRLGTLTANPVPLADQVAAATKAAAERLKTRDALLNAAKASDGALQKVNTDLANARKLVADTAAAAKAAEAKLAQVRTAVTNAQAALKGAQQEAKAKQVLAKELTDAAAKVRAEADKAKDNAPLQAAALRALALSGQASAEWVLAQKTSDDLAAAVRAVEPTLAPAQTAFNTAQAATVNPPKAIPGLEAALKAAQAKAGADRAAFTPGEAALKEAQEKLARLQKLVPPAKK